ncbi:MAG: AbrB/MazE/SpoVT family DNA-binding domain-containing protein [Deltaproteobacteria bacterium]|nr:AbrB/MazE/SpoVT family DNA-binding domain-containing protein [Deltaproteobacteria bacterium]
METRVTTKGQIVIPAALRRRLKIQKGTIFSVSERDGKIILEPIFDDPIKAGRGMLLTRGKVLRRLIEDRKAESER